MILRAGKRQLWRTWGISSPKVRPFFCVKSKCLWKTVTLSSRNPIFRQIFVCTREMHFWRVCQNFWAKFGKSSYWNPEIDEKIPHCWIAISKLTSRKRKLSLVNSEQATFCLIKKISPLSPKNIWKTKFFRGVVFI